MKLRSLKSPGRFRLIDTGHEKRGDFADSEKMTEKCDVIVAGAGPAGSRTARNLARCGFDVILLDDHAAVGEPCHCSGLVTPRTLEVAEAGPGLIMNSIRGATFQTRNGAALQLTGDVARALAIDRVELDRRLAQQAVQAGARLRTGSRFSRFQTEGSTGHRGGSIRVSLEEQGSLREIRARLLVGADGALSRVALQSRGGGRRPGVRAIGGEAVYRGNQLSDHVQVFLDDEAAPGWFGWTIPMAPGRARLGTGTTNGLRPLDSLNILKEAFPEHFAGSRFIRRQAGFIPVWEPTPMASDRVVLVGDAARQVKPSSGGGILTALVSAEVAAHETSLALHQGDLSAGRLAAYSRAWDRQVGRELQRQHDMRRALSRLDDRRVRSLLETLTAPKVRARIEVSGDIDFPSRLVWRLLIHHPAIVLGNLVAPRFPFAWLFPRQARPASP